MRIKLFAVFAALSLSACVTPQAPLSEIKPQFPSIDVAMVDSQDEIFINRGQPYQQSTYYYVPAGTSPGAAAAGGAIAFLIMAGIESAEAADAKRDAAPLNEALAEFDFDALLRSEFESALANFTWTRVENFSVLDDPSLDALGAVVTESQQPGVLVVGANYYLSNIADSLIVSGQALLHPKPDPERDAKRINPRRGPPPAVFAVNVSYEMPATTSGNRRADHIPYWAANDAEALRSALTEGAVKVALMLKQQLEEGVTPFKPARGETYEKRAIKAFNGLKVKVQILESTSEGELVRTQDGSLRFLARPAATEAVEPEPSPDSTPDEAPAETPADPALQG